MQKNTDLYIVFHRPVEYGITNNDFLTPLQVGTECNGTINDYGGRHDNEGQDNISIWNPLFCEGTGLYWIWKSLTGKPYAGMFQYRRRFDLKSIKQLDDIFSSYDVIAAQPLFLIGSVRLQYSIFHNEHDIALAEKIIHKALTQPDTPVAVNQTSVFAAKLQHFSTFKLFDTKFKPITFQQFPIYSIFFHFSSTFLYFSDFFYTLQKVPDEKS